MAAVLLLATCAKVSAQGQADFQQASGLVVMIESTIQGRLQRGAGIIYSIEPEAYIVVTANHTVRAGDQNQYLASSVYVMFHEYPEDRVFAKVMNYYDSNLDVAVLRVPRNEVPDQIVSRVPFRLATKEPAVSRGAAIYPIGYLKDVPWVSPIDPARFDRKSGDDIYFQSLHVKKGYSGGGLFDSNWRLMGMVTSATNAPVVKALSIERIKQTMRKWDFVAGITNHRSVDTNPVGEDIDEVLSSWDNLTNYYRNRLIKLKIRNVSNLPNVDDGFGAPEFGVQVIRSDGDTRTFEISANRSVTTKSYDVGDTRTLSLRVVEVDVFSHDEITREQLTSLEQLLSGRQFRLNISLPGYGQGARMVHLFAKAVFFDPESESGTDSNYQAAMPVALDRVLEDSVDFERGDATDHLRLNSNRGKCDALLLARYNEDVNILYSTNDGRTTVETLYYGEKYSGNDDENKTAVARLSLYDVNCSSYPVNLKIQSYKPRMYADYHIYPSGVGLSSETATRMLGWILDTSDNHAADPSSREPLQVLNRIQSFTATRTSAMIEAFDRYMRSNWTGKAPLDLLDKLFESYSPVIDTCCKNARIMRLVNEIQKAERNLPFDRSMVFGEHSFMPDNIEDRISALEKNN